jgi:hypothetical protein
MSSRKIGTVVDAQQILHRRLMSHQASTQTIEIAVSTRLTLSSVDKSKD